MIREPQLHNDIFFVCALIEKTARMTKNKRADIVQTIGKKKLAHILNLADVYHCAPIELTADELIENYAIKTGAFDNESACIYTVPYFMDIARVYMRLIVNVMEEHTLPPIDALIEVYTSWISEKIDNYNSSFYYENPHYIFQSYLAGEPLKD